MLPILHVDMNAFYASCHQAIDPELRGKPVLVAGDPKKRNGIILTASYEARRYGVRTAMPNWEARQLCPQGIFIKPDYDLYVRFSNKVMEILDRFTPLVEAFSIDEAWLDVTGCEGLFGDSVTIGKQIQQAIYQELGLPCSVGVSSNKLLAKMASDLKKPMGLTALAPKDIPKILWPLPVDDLFGVGRHIAQKLQKMNINTIGDLARVPESLLVQSFGINGRYLSLSAKGIDNSPVDPRALDGAKSMGHSVTLPKDVTSWEEAEAVLLSLAEKVGRRVRRENYMGRTVTITLRDKFFGTITRSSTVPYTDSTDDIYAVAKRLLYANWNGKTPLRLLGVSLSQLVKQFEQLSLFQGDEKKKKLDNAIDEIRDKFGDNAIFRAKLKSQDSWEKRPLFKRDSRA